MPCGPWLPQVWGRGAGKAGRAVPESGDGWLEVDFSPWGSGPAGKRVFATLKTAILSRREIAFDYYSARRKSRRTAQPVKLVYKDAAWYLQAYCLARQALRVFKLCRMLDVTLLDAVFTPGPARPSRWTRRRPRSFCIWS